MTSRLLRPAPSHRAIPPIVSGYSLPGKWSVVVPATEDITNLVANPSVETNTTGYTAVGGSVAQSLEQQFAGAYSLKVTPTAGTGDGAYYGTVATVAGQRYPWVFGFYGGASGARYTAYWATTGGVQVGTAVTFYGSQKWQRVIVPYEETATTTRRLYVVKSGHARVNPFYLDGLLVPSDAAGMDEWRYFDGDTQGFVPNLTQFYWNGTPHGSTSVMRAHTRAGGKIVSLASYGLTVLAVIGQGLPTPNNIAIPLALPGGQQYQRTLTPAHEFTLAASLQAGSQLELSRQHAALTAALDVTRQPITQPLILQFDPEDDCGNSMGDTVEIVCSPSGGLEGQRDNPYQENLALRFTVHVPYVATGESTEGASLDVRTELADADYAVYRDVNGIWRDLSVGLTGQLRAALWMPDGRLLLGGAFTNVDGDADADYLVYYDPQGDVFSTVNATPLSAQVTALLLLPDGNVLVGGDFTNAGGDADADYLCLLTVGTGAYSALNATPLSFSVTSLALLPDFTVAVGGAFTNAGGDTNADYLCRLTLSTGAYSAFTGTPLNLTVLTLEVTDSQTLWIGGAFTDVDGVASQDYLTALRSPDYDDFQLVIPANNPLGGIVNVIRSLSNGTLLVGGNFVDVNGDSDWDGMFIGIPAPAGGPGEIALLRLKLFGGINNTVNAASEINPGLVLVGGGFTEVAGISLFDRMFAYVGNSLIPIDLDLPGSPAVNAIESRPGTYEVVLGYTTSGSGYTSGTTEVENSGSADAFPVITIEYDAAATVVAPLYSIRNLTTGDVLSFNLSLLPGEVLTIDLRPNAKTVVSSIRGNLNGTVLPGSNLATFRLSPGPNVINIFVDIASAANASASAWWVPTFKNLADAWDN